jgi:hypothetical protein
VKFTERGRPAHLGSGTEGDIGANEALLLRFLTTWVGSALGAGKEAGREMFERSGAAHVWWLSSCLKKLSVGLANDVVWRYCDLRRGFGVFLINGSGSVFGLGFGRVCNFGNGSGSTNRTVGGDDFLCGVVFIDSEDLRLGFKLDRLGLDADDEDEDTSDS